MTNISYNFNENKYYRVSSRYDTHMNSPTCAMYIEEMHFNKTNYLVPPSEVIRASESGIIMVKHKPVVLHVGDTIKDMETHKLYEYVVDEKTHNSFRLKYLKTEEPPHVIINLGGGESDNKPSKSTRKIIPHPTNCKNCGAVMTGYKCVYCGTDYPEYE
jgi:hypothetical protein